FFKNPNKADRKSLNVVTTTSFANADIIDGTLAVVDALTRETSGRVTAQTVSQLTRALDHAQGDGFTTMYGVHGVDENPHHDPLFDPAALCRPCTTNDACGADGNRCTRVASDLAACTYGCTSDTGCPAGYACTPIGSLSAKTVKTKQ